MIWFQPENVAAFLGAVRAGRRDFYSDSSWPTWCCPAAPRGGYAGRCEILEGKVLGYQPPPKNNRDHEITIFRGWSNTMQKNVTFFLCMFFGLAKSTRKTTQKLTKRAQKGSKQSVLPIINSSFWLFVAETVRSERIGVCYMLTIMCPTVVLFWGGWAKRSHGKEKNSVI